MLITPSPREVRTEGSPEDEIRILEQQLEAKKRALEERGEAAPHEKELLREVLREHIEKERAGSEEVKRPTITPPSTGAPATTQAAKKQDARQEEIHALVEFALTKSIKEAVKIAEGDSPYLLDELHDHLVDDYYDKMVALRKIEPDL